MLIRSLMAFLLITSLTAEALGRSPIRQDETPLQTQDQKLTPEEEREARALVEEFVERLDKSGDVTPIVEELYIGDFPDRLRDRMGTLIPLAATPEVVAQMSSEEILRAYIASINCMYLASRLFIEWDQKQKQEKARRGDAEDKDERREPKISELIPASLVNLIQSDPWLAALLEQVIKEENDSTSEQDQEEDPGDNESIENIWPFKSLEQMLHYMSLTEQGVKLLREHLNSLPPEFRPSITQFASDSSKTSSGDEPCEMEDKFNIRPHVLSDEFMGYSIGTHIICASVWIFHMDMVRDTDGRLKVLHVHVQMD